MRTLTRERALEQMIKTNRQIEESLGKKPIWFAPPSGSFKEETVKLAKQEGMETIMWTVDTIDWQNHHQLYYKNSAWENSQWGDDINASNRRNSEKS